MGVKDIVIIGCGGLGREVCNYISDINANGQIYNILGFIDDNPANWGLEYNEIKVLGGSKELAGICISREIYGFCAIANPQDKMNIYSILKKLSIETVNIVHPTAYISPFVELGDNVLIGPMCVLTTNIKIGNCVHINPQCGIGHDSQIGDYTTLYWNVNVSGAVEIGKMCELGSKTVIKQQLTLGDGVITGAGSVVVNDIADWAIVKGVPARRKTEL